MKDASRAPLRGDNKLRSEDRAAHGWYRFVLSFPPHLVRDYIERFGIDSRNCVLDPFCGTGTTLIECKMLGIPSVGIEPNPMARFASMVKLDWSVDPDGLLNHAHQIATLTLQQLEEQGIEDAQDLPLSSTDRYDAGKLRTLSADARKLLLKDSISPLPLHKTLVLLETLKQYDDERFGRHERLALARAIVSDISNLHFGPEIGVGPARPGAPGSNGPPRAIMR